MPTLDLRAIKTFPQLIKYLRDELEWPIEGSDFEDLTFDYSPEELGLDSKTAAKIKEIKQLRPLESKQPWGIFFVNFEPQKLPVVALRRILRALVVKKRQSSNRAQQATWQKRDLLFISTYGESEHRDITFAHFSDEKEGDLPVLRVLGWDDEDTALHTQYTDKMLREKLHWPSNRNDIEEWRKQWSEAFTLKHQQVIKTSKELAMRLAELASRIRKRAKAVLAIESDKGPLKKLHAAFKEALIHDLTEDDFADTYAQTISYGLLTARISRPAGLVADNLKDMVPVTNPFLKELLETFLSVGGRKGKIDFDELGINEVVELLRDAEMEAVLRDFGDKNPAEDPAIHFYELFLKEYDPKKRMQRGVFYTPRPVVSFIVRSVHEILQKEFGLVDGLADITTWGELAKRVKRLKIPVGISSQDPFVKILDPATGTGTFLVEVIEVIYQTMEKKWIKAGHMAFEIPDLWNEYVPEHLLPRLYGYELMMAPYAIAHMKIGLKLNETRYKFGSEERARIYLTNALEPTQNFSDRFIFEAPALAHEAEAVNRVKKAEKFTVLIGNPPYSNFGQLNRIPSILALLEDYKRELDERKINLDDDYIKFIRFAQFCLDESGAGVFGMITNNSYLDGITHRRMRESLCNSLGKLKIINLHGSATLSSADDSEQSDENVFDIKQGVGISLGVKHPALAAAGVEYTSLRGCRSSKYASLTWLKTGDFQKLTTIPPFHFFVPKDFSKREEYEVSVPLREVFHEYNTGIQTKRDSLTIHFDQASLIKVIRDLISLPNADLRKKYDLPADGRDWKIDLAKADVGTGVKNELIKKILYRPFDFRWTYFTGRTKGFLAYPRRETMKHMLQPNLALMTLRINGEGKDFVVFCADCLVEKGSLPRGNYSVFPLYLYPSSKAMFGGDGREANLRQEFMKHFQELQTGIVPEDVFSYIYALFHSQEYRKRYAEFLKIDFPRVFLPKSASLYVRMASFGRTLLALHTLKESSASQLATRYVGPPEVKIESVRRVGKDVWLSSEGNPRFENIPNHVWTAYVGGYQVCEKWLKDRRGRLLSKDDIEHYRKIVATISETIRLMPEIDKAIEQHGGWPAAFATRSKKKAVSPLN